MMLHILSLDPFSDKFLFQPLRVSVRQSIPLPLLLAHLSSILSLDGRILTQQVEGIFIKLIQ